MMASLLALSIQKKEIQGGKTLMLVHEQHVPFVNRPFGSRW